MLKHRNNDWMDEVKACLQPINDAQFDAAVLILLRQSQGQLQVLLTQRSENLRHHASEWSLPGGKKESNERQFDTALRESNEEVGLLSEDTLPLGQLDHFASKDGLSVAVCVSALTRANAQFILNEDEVQKITWLDVRHIMQKPDREKQFERNGVKINVPYYDLLEPSLWGLTAMILQALIKNIDAQIQHKQSLQVLLSKQ